MLKTITSSPLTFKIMAFIAIAFGALTIKSGGMVLFTSGEAHQAAGHYVPFVLWFNFLAGFIYIVTGIGLWLQKSWASTTAIALAASTLFVFLLFGLTIFLGSAYETKTVGAMSLRSFIWISIAFIAFKAQQNKSID